MGARPRWPGGVILTAVCLAYANSFGNAFHFDDFHTVTDNPAIRSLRHVPRFFTDATTFSVLPTNRTYRPVVSLSLAVDYAIGRGYRPWAFHLGTFCWFLLLIALLAGLYRRILLAAGSGKNQAAWLGWMAAGWFGLHPAAAETVNYVIQRGDLYATLGCVAGLWLWAWAPAHRRWGLYLVPVALAMLSKPTAAVFPMLLLFWVLWIEERRWAEAMKAAVPSLVLVAAGLWLQARMTPKSFAPTQLSAGAYRLTQPYVWLRYFTAWFLPLHLNVDTDLEAFRGWNLRAVAGVGFAVALIVAIVPAARQRRWRPVAFGLLWFLVAQVPTSWYPLAEVENDHRMFFSFAGLSVAVMWLIWLGMERFAARRTGVWAACAAVGLAAYGLGTVERNRVWHTEASLWADDVRKSPGNGRGWMIYGLNQMSKGDYGQALQCFQKALVLTPNYPTLEINLGVVLGAMGRDAEAETHFERARQLAPANDEAWAYEGRWMLGQGRAEEAVEKLRTAVALNPARELGHDLLMEALAAHGDLSGLHDAAAATLQAMPEDPMARRAFADPKSVVADEQVERSLEAYRRGDWQRSLAWAEQAVAIHPDSAAAWNNIGAAQGQMGQWTQAVEAEQRAVALDPRLEIARNNLALYRGKLEQVRSSAEGAAPMTVAGWVERSLLLNRAGRYQESLQAARAALKIDPRSAEAWNNVAAAEESMRHWDAAIAAAERAVELRPDLTVARNNLSWSEEQKRAGAK